MKQTEHSEACCQRKGITYISLVTALNVISNQGLTSTEERGALDPFVPRSFSRWQGHLQKLVLSSTCRNRMLSICPPSASAAEPLPLPRMISPTLHLTCSSCRWEKVFPDSTSSWWPLLTSFSSTFWWYHLLRLNCIALCTTEDK